MSVWSDITSYSQGDKDRTPRSFELMLEGCRLVVTRKIHCSGWYADAPPFFSGRALRNEHSELAKAVAVADLISEMERALIAASKTLRQSATDLEQRKAGKEE